MRRRRRLVLPIVGLVLFAGETYHSVRTNREGSSAPSRYFWWSFIRLDSDPGSKSPQVPAPCKSGEEHCVSWDLPNRWIDPGWLSEWLMLSAAPAFIVEAVVLGSLRHLGVNEIWVFMISMPMLIFGWYYFIGWLIDLRTSSRDRIT
jgi:hypothetical protein